MTDTIDISVVRERFHGRQDGIRAGASNAPRVDQTIALRSARSHISTHAERCP